MINKRRHPKGQILTHGKCESLTIHSIDAPRLLVQRSLFIRKQKRKKYLTVNDILPLDIFGCHPLKSLKVMDKISR